MKSCHITPLMYYTSIYFLCNVPPLIFADRSSQSPVQYDELANGRPLSPSPCVSGPPPPMDSLSSPEPLRPKEPPLPAVLSDKGRVSDPIPGKSSSLLSSIRQPLFTKERSAGVNGKSKPWESFTAEKFAQQFHESVLQSTQKALQRSKGSSRILIIY